MKATIDFNLDNEDEKDRFNMAIKAMDMYLAIHEFREELRKLYKYPEDGICEETVEKIRSKFFEIMESRQVPL